MTSTDSTPDTTDAAATGPVGTAAVLAQATAVREEWKKEVTDLIRATHEELSAAAERRQAEHTRRFREDVGLTPDVVEAFAEDVAAAAEPDEFAAVRRRLITGGSFVLDIPDTIPAVWGDGTRVAWAEGEALIIAGGPGVGKTTVAGQLVRGMILGGQDVLGMPVARRKRILYLAMDRPRQAARALRRSLGDIPRDVLDDRLLIWQGPPLADMAKDSTLLAGMAHIAAADVVVVDSLKDAAVGLSADEVGAGYNRCRQNALTEGVDVLELHHTVKNGVGGGAPTSLSDIYGSTWITSGAGSVILLHGAPGDLIVECKHLKQPADDIGPFKVLHDHEAGMSTVHDSADLVAMASRPLGITAKEAAEALFETDKPANNQVEKARRKLGALVKSGALVEEPGNKATSTPSRWRKKTITVVQEPFTAPFTAPETREPFTPPSHPSRSDEEPQVRGITDTFTTITPGDHHVSPSPCKGGERESGPVATCKECGKELTPMRAARFDVCTKCRARAAGIGA